MSAADQRRHDLAHRSGALWIAALVHRVSGVLLALFLPLHFLVLALALRGEGTFDSVLIWSRLPVVRLAETVLVGLLVVHVLGGIRLLVIETLGWRDDQKRWAMAVLMAAVLAGLVFLARSV